MTTYSLVNPRPKHRRRRRGRRHVARTRRRRRPRRRFAHLFAPRRRHTRRRRGGRRRRHMRRRARRNPRFTAGGLMGGMQAGLAVASGVVATNLATGAVLHYGGAAIPATLQTGVGKMALKFGVGVVALPMVLRMTPLRGFASKVALGAWAAIILDAYAEWVAPMLKTSLGFSGYEFDQLSGYEVGQLSGYTGGSLVESVGGAGAYTGGIYGQGVM